LRVIAVGGDAAVIPLSGALPIAHGTLHILNAGAVLATTLGALDSGSIAVSAGALRSTVKAVAQRLRASRVSPL
jgi:hypothetical protein